MIFSRSFLDWYNLENFPDNWYFFLLIKIVNIKCSDLRNVRAGCLENKLCMPSDHFALLTALLTILLVLS